MLTSSAIYNYMSHPFSFHKPNTSQSKPSPNIIAQSNKPSLKHTIKLGYKHTKDLGQRNTLTTWLEHTHISARSPRLSIPSSKANINHQHNHSPYAYRTITNPNTPTPSNQNLSSYTLRYPWKILVTKTRHHTSYDIHGKIQLKQFHLFP